jgi:hypothetical protein
MLSPSQNWAGRTLAGRDDLSRIPGGGQIDAPPLSAVQRDQAAAHADLDRPAIPSVSSSSSVPWTALLMRINHRAFGTRGPRIA